MLAAKLFLRLHYFIHQTKEIPQMLELTTDNAKTKNCHKRLWQTALDLSMLGCVEVGGNPRQTMVGRRRLILSLAP